MNARPPANERSSTSERTFVDPRTNGRPVWNERSSSSDLQLYPVSVKTQTGEKLELQLNPGDSVMDVRQFLLDAPEKCLSHAMIYCCIRRMHQLITWKIIMKFLKYS
ncbi:hypothetical protein VIGAN_07189200 [Vigna angularis var. angularis]|uniref:Uncharacterized protein n=1 Tax=Vigna angularis var. angularis TaxID=157739 RepID=A0A0S3SJN7_PHAAN|nr:hypothetical protein VIGAN_07189200 [Vigna angularis var. angularis]